MAFKTYFISFFLFLIATNGFSQSVDSTAFGWLSIDTKVDTFHVVIDRDFSNSYYIKGDSLQVKTGRHELVIIHSEYEDYRTNINIKRGSNKLVFNNFKRIEKDSTLSSYKRITEGIPFNITIITDNNSLIVIDDSTYAKGFLKTDIGPYNHKIKVKHPTARDKTEEIYINPSGQQKITLFAKPKRSISYLLSLVPAGSQWYKNQKLKATILTASTIGVATYAILKVRGYNRLNKEYKAMIAKYQNIPEEQDALEYGNLVDQKYDDVNKAASFRDISLAVLGGLYIYNMFDAIFSKPKSGYQINIQPVNMSFGSGQSAGVKLKVSF